MARLCFSMKRELKVDVLAKRKRVRERETGYDYAGVGNEVVHYIKRIYINQQQILHASWV